MAPIASWDGAWTGSWRIGPLEPPYLPTLGSTDPVGAFKGPAPSPTPPYRMKALHPVFCTRDHSLYDFAPGGGAPERSLVCGRISSISSATHVALKLHPAPLRLRSLRRIFCVPQALAVAPAGIRRGDNPLSSIRSRPPWVHFSHRTGPASSPHYHARGNAPCSPLRLLRPFVG